jgi:hypothetical protein
MERVKAIQSTWTKNLKHKYYFVSGDDLDVDNFIKIDFNECYEQLPLKTYITLKSTFTIEYDYLVKLDDDTFINTDNFAILPENFDYAGKFNSAKNNNPSTHFYKVTNKNYKVNKQLPKFDYAEGGFYILSKKAVSEIISVEKSFFVNTPENYRGEDVCVGEILNHKKFIKLDLNSKYSKLLNMDITTDNISIHPVQPECMFKLIDMNYDNQIKYFEQNPTKNNYNIRDLYLKVR